MGPFRIFKVQNDGELHFVEAVQAFEDAKGRVRELGNVWPGEYVIDNEETGERTFVSTRGETKNLYGPRSTISCIELDRQSVYFSRPCPLHAGPWPARNVTKNSRTRTSAKLPVERETRLHGLLNRKYQKAQNSSVHTAVRTRPTELLICGIAQIKAISVVMRDGLATRLVLP